MTGVPRPKLTPAEYLAIERKAKSRSEYVNGEMFAMAGAGLAHNLITENLSIGIGSRLRGGPCRTLSRDMRVRVSATGLYTYPDVLVPCGPPEMEGDDNLLNPTVIIEVLSDSTAKYDRGTKFRHYQKLNSFQEYILVEQDEPAIDRFVRQPNGDWLSTSITGLESELALMTVPVRIKLSDIYAGVQFRETPTQ